MMIHQLKHYCFSLIMDGRFNHAHLRHTRHLDHIDNWENHKLPDDEIAVPLKHQPPLTEDNDDFNNLLPEQLKSENKKWTDLALDFLNDEPQQLQNQNPQQSQQIQ
ncbi:hypothetical protein RhiirC2_854353 [Rhizophagus irregularis]|uniref:Uncharacterized protein n=2 Tax=Rhizophagus irregularis TaxID=588596 RepID=A0A2N1MRW1_9GLOM|nr:hypothetical protein RhiirC2_854353 [Rhizophagus irregularis]